MLNGLDLFSGIGGLALALSPWVRTIAYCENDRYAQSVLFCRMRSGKLPIAPIWDDVRFLRGEQIPVVDCIYGGFPCQDISVAGLRAGLDGSRSGLFFEIIRLAREVRPRFIFLENVPAITVRGLDRVLLELTALGFDSRWTIVSAAEMGAPHLRERWFLLAYADCNGLRLKQPWSEGRESREQGLARTDGEKGLVADSYGFRESQRTKSGNEERTRALDGGQAMANAESIGSIEGGLPKRSKAQHSVFDDRSERPRWGSQWATEPDVGRVAHGIPARVDRLRGLGNAVVPAQAREAFIRLMGL